MRRVLGGDGTEQVQHAVDDARLSVVVVKAGTVCANVWDPVLHWDDLIPAQLYSLHSHQPIGHVQPVLVHVRRLDTQIDGRFVLLPAHLRLLVRGRRSQPRHMHEFRRSDGVRLVGDGLPIGGYISAELVSDGLRRRRLSGAFGWQQLGGGRQIQLQNEKDQVVSSAS